MNCVDTVIQVFQYQAIIFFESIVWSFRTVRIVLQRPQKILSFQIIATGW